MLTRDEIDARVADVEQALGELDRGEPREAALYSTTHRVFQALRQQYRQDPASMAAHVEALASQSRRFDEILRARLPELVDRFHQLTAQIRAAQQEKDDLRKVLIELSTATGQSSLAGQDARVKVEASKGTRLPSANSDERARILELVRQAGMWERVSILSTAKLNSALKNDEFEEADRQAIEVLLVGGGHRVVSRPAENEV